MDCLAGAACFFAAAVSLSATLASADDALPKTPAEAARMEAKDALPLTHFYDTPANLSATKPGALLRSETVEQYALPKGARGVRILYHSRDAAGRDVATSGVVLIPAGRAPAGGWPVIAWAHGTSGVARSCAPSAMKDVYYGEEGLFPMVRAGFAVVATDYHGLGTLGPHQYVSKTAQAYDVIFSIPAAHAAVPALGKSWVVDGHSQGGLAAWSVAEMEAQLRDPDYRGAVAVAGALRFEGFLDNAALGRGAGFYFPLIAYGIAAQEAGFAPQDMLSQRALEHYADMTQKGCWLYAYATYAGVPPSEMLRPGWNKLPAVRKWVSDNTTVKAPIAGPVLMIAGEADQSVPLAGLRATFAAACKKGMTVTFRSYPGLDHDPTMANSTPDQLAWIRDRLAGKPARSNCGAISPPGR
jgi:pimeloyl-ACP methyl ester carboxylesterase